MLMIQTCVKARMHASMRTAATTRHTASLNRYKSNKVFLRPEMKMEECDEKSDRNDAQCLRDGQTSISKKSHFIAFLGSNAS